MTAATVEYETGLVNSAGTIRRLQALVAIGWPQAQLAARLGVRWAVFADLMRSGLTAEATAAAVRRLYDQLWDKPPTGRYASRAQAFACARDWPPPLGWDEDCGDGHDIDDPDATPAPGWKRTDRRTQPSAQIVPDALWLMAQGFTREQAATRLGISRAGLEKAFARQRAATHELSTQEGSSTMPETRQQRSIPCNCGARRGERCTPKGDHLGRFMDAGKRGEIGRPDLVRAVEGLDIIAPAAIVPSQQAELEREAG